MLDPQNPSGSLNYNRHVNVNSTVINAADVCRSLKLNWQCISLDGEVHVYEDIKKTFGQHNMRIKTMQASDQIF
jgi:hypothetical protein